MYNDFEFGIDDLKIYLINNDSNEIIDSAITVNFEFNFPSTNSIIIPAGNYYLEIAIEEYNIGGNLLGFYSCPVSNPANDFVDLDDNGTDFVPSHTSVFGLDTGIGTVEYIDFCFTFDCLEEVLLASPVCEEINEADVFCSISALDNICGLMPTNDSPGNQPNPLCPDGGGPHNISWFAFIADDGDYSVTVTPTGCTGSTTGQEGVQMGLYTDCTFTETVFCDPECSTDPVTFESDLLIPGETYYFFIDGCANSVCSYEISVSGNPIPHLFEIEEICLVVDNNLVCEGSEFCTGEEVLFETTIQDGDVTYTWSITTLSDGPYTGDPSPLTVDNIIELIFDNEGIYSVCLEQVDNECAIWSGAECRTVTIIEGNVGVEVFNSISICEDLISEFDPSVLDDQDPNGDGFSGWIDSTYVFSFGENVSTTSDSFYCAFKQKINIILIENAEISLNANDESICLGDTVQLGFDTSGDYDSIVWSINNIIQTDSIGSLIPEVGENEIVATIYNSCDSGVDTVIVQVRDTLLSPDIICDTSIVGSIILSWPPVENVEEYWLSINGGDLFVVSDTNYVIENLGSGEVVEIKSNIIDPTRCFGFATSFTCTAATIVGITEQSADDIKIIPNPTSDYIIIDGDFVSSNAIYRIHAIDGRQILSGRLDDTKQINVMNLPVGLYLINVHQNDDGRKWIKRFVKQ